MWRELLVKEEELADVGIFGIAVDANCSIEKGASEAPRLMRECSEYLPPFTIRGQEITTKVFDYGDVCTFDQKEVDAFMDAALKKPFVLILGGDHSVSILSEKSFKERVKGKVGLIHIDAHADICDVYQGSKISHACVNRRAIENGYLEEDITMLGIRSFERQERDFLEKSKVTLYTAEQIFEEGIGAVVEKVLQKYEGYDAVYLSLDIDSVDPAFAPGTGTPEAFGLSSKDLLKILTGLIKNLPVRVMDIVEVSPPLDTNNITTWLALKYILEILYLIK